MNRVCEILGIEKPVIQAPMLWITSPELVAAVSNAGGLGVLGFCAGYEKKVSTAEETKEEMRKAIRRTKELTDKPFGVDVAPEADDKFGFSKGILDVMREEGVKVIVFAGNTITGEQIRPLKAEGFKVIARQINPTVRGAQEIEAAGADIIVATGCDEGGCMPNMTLGMAAVTALFAANVHIPVLSAGGIVNEAMAKASHAVGAEGAYVGSRFILSKECRAAQNVKEDLMQTHPDDMVVFTQWNGASKWRSTPHKVALQALAENEKGNLNPSAGSLFAGMFKGDLDASVNSACNVISLVKDISSSEDIVNEIAKGYED